MSKPVHVVVVGGTSGIGRHVAESFAGRGCDVVITGRTDDRAKSVAGEIGGRTRGLAVDLGEPEQIPAALADVQQVDRLVIAALERDHNTVRDYRPEAATRTLTMKLIGYTTVVHALSSRMSADAAAVLLGGLAMHRPYPGSTTVTTANGGISALVRTLVTELAPIRFNALHPSLVVDTPHWRTKVDICAATKARTPTKRLVTMQDCTDAVMFLLENPAINGVNLSIDGGELLV
ncbi:SDR family NAD(P)-dependent oxidoreductase [Micromonospora sp. C95]|uniref:SDR family NAD(P)-dependent oxidoreductase n=1 Tax=Micromonospora sp. C95 TaxID=2824882 RepID=UPI001B372E38|nr:SDR family oxidoreductase [Micromonospora sp. C95]MBQ1023704.1 SDR family oxidoreductase [Micromonospora sp. C95]